MWHVPGELHDVSLRLMRRLMYSVLLLPPRPVLQLKLLYTVGLIIYLAFINHWRFSFNYYVVYDLLNDNFSRVIDLLNFVTLMICHCVVGLELLYRNHSEHIEQQLERIRYILRVQFGHRISLRRLGYYCSAIYGSLLLRCMALMGMAICNQLVTNTALLLFYSFYSEVILLLRFSEFTLYSVMILSFYLELKDVGLKLIQELERTRFEIYSVRLLSLQRLSTLQEVHGLLWHTLRSIECNFELSLIMIMFKFFMDTSLLPYWIFLNVYNQDNVVITYYCITEELCKLLEILVPCYICNRCELLQRQFRSIFHSLATDRSNTQLNSALINISAQLGQERCQFSAGGLLLINNVSLGKFIFGMVSYIVICIQFRLSLLAKTPADATEHSFTEAA